MAQRKITFIGDIMCEPLLMNAAKIKDGYDFNCVFEHVRHMFDDSDYVIGNLETPLAGENLVYTHDLFSFNAPDELANALKSAGIDLVTTANNHCLDRGIDGLLRTIKILKEKNIAFTGTFPSGKERKEAAYFCMEGMRFAVISYTYGTNYAANRILLNEEQKGLVNLLRPQQELYFKPAESVHKIHLWERAFRKFLSFFCEEKQIFIKKLLHMTYYVAHQDDSLDKETAEPYIRQLEEDIKKAKENADFVLFYPHIGGQFNSEPGVFSEYVFDRAVKAGCDAIIASHPHVVLKANNIQGVPCFYSIGNFSMSPNSCYLLYENLPQFGLAVHLYIEESGIEKTTFSILKTVETKGKPLSVYPVDQLVREIDNDKQKDQLIKEAERIYTIVVGRKMRKFHIEREYPL